MRLLYAEEDRYRLLARNMTDVITRHGRNGSGGVRLIGGRPLFGALPGAARPVRPCTWRIGRPI
jgi:cell cycle sensor histidine kinase DivJ